MLLVLLTAPAAVIGFCSVELLQYFTGQSMPVPWSAATTLAILALALFIWALLIRPRILRKPGTKPLSPFVAARTAALAMAASRTGALVGGFYLGVALELAARLDNAFARERMWLALAAVATSLLVVLAALWLEYICRLPDKEDGADGPSRRSDHVDDNSDWVLPSRRTG